MATVKARAVRDPKGKLQPFTYETGPLAPEQVEIKVEHCGICHTDLGFIASRGVVDKMLRFAAQHHIAPITEHFPMSKVNEAIQKIESGKAAYRVVLDADF